MLSGREKGRASAKSFKEWLDTKSDEQLMQYLANNDSTILNRTQLAKAVGFRDRKRITNNKSCMEHLRARELTLMEKGYLDKKNEKLARAQIIPCESQTKNLKGSRRIDELEKKVFELQSQINILKTEKDRAENKNARLSEFSETLDEIKGGIWG